MQATVPPPPRALIELLATLTRRAAQRPRPAPQPAPMQR